MIIDTGAKLNIGSENQFQSLCLDVAKKLGFKINVKRVDAQKLNGIFYEEFERSIWQQIFGSPKRYRYEGVLTFNQTDSTYKFESNWFKINSKNQHQKLDQSQKPSIEVDETNLVKEIEMWKSK
jgi:hypothetical protein